MNYGVGTVLAVNGWFQLVFCRRKLFVFVKLPGFGKVFFLYLVFATQNIYHHLFSRYSWNKNGFQIRTNYAPNKRDFRHECQKDIDAYI